MSFLTNRMASFTEFPMKLDWCGCILNNGNTNSDQRNNYVCGLQGFKN